MKAYTEKSVGDVGVPVYDYGCWKWFTVFDYTGGESLFNIPSIDVDGGAKVANRFLNLTLEFDQAPTQAEKLCVLVFHRCKNILVFNTNMSMELVR